MLNLKRKLRIVDEENIIQELVEENVESSTDTEPNDENQLPYSEQKDTLENKEELYLRERLGINGKRPINCRICKKSRPSNSTSS